MLSCRRILSIMVITCFLLHQMLRVNLSLAIVDMVESNTTNRTPYERFSWTEEQKGQVIGSYLCGQLLTSLPGGRLSEMYGTRKVLGFAMLTASILTMFTPMLAHFHYYFLLLGRVGLGLALGVCNPSIPPLIVKWIAPTNISKFLSHTRACYLGGAITLPVCGFLIANFGWKSVFYLNGILGLIWSIFWFSLIYDSPEKHPRISQNEKDTIAKEIRPCVEKNKRKKTPWKKILLSAPVWVLIVSGSCYLLSANMGFNYLPTYIHDVLHVNIKNNGFLGGLPYVGSYLSAYGASCLADRWLKTETFRTITVRRIFAGLTFGGSALAFGIIAFWGDDLIMSVVCFVFWFCCWGCSTPSLGANIIDVAPSYSGTVTGMMYTLGTFVAYLETIFIAIVIEDNQTLAQWRNVFWLLIGANLLGFVIFLTFCTSEAQSWNFPNRRVKPETEIADNPESVNLKS